MGVGAPPLRGTCLGWQRSHQPLLRGRAWSSRAPGSPGSRPAQAPGRCCQRWLFPHLKNLPTDETFSSAVAFPSWATQALSPGEATSDPGPLQCFWNRVCQDSCFSQRRKEKERHPTIREAGSRTGAYLLWPSSGPRARRQPHSDGGSQEDPQPGRGHALCKLEMRARRSS